MSHKTTLLTPSLYRYLLQIGIREAPVLQQLREDTMARFPEHINMQIAPEQGAIMSMLVELIGARKTLDVGVFTGYSALAVALALPRDGSVIACDINEQWTSFASKYWSKAGVAEKIDLRLDPAIETMEALLSEGCADTFDFVFLDAEKTEYEDYYERAITLLRPGGLCAIDNVLWSGKPVEDSAEDKDTVAIRSFNKLVHADKRVSVSLVPIADGLTLARKR